MGWAKYNEDIHKLAEENRQRRAIRTYPIAKESEYETKNFKPDPYLSGKATTIRISYSCVAAVMPRR